MITCGCFESFFACGCGLIFAMGASKGLHFHWFGNAPSRALLSFHTRCFVNASQRSVELENATMYVRVHKDNPLMLLLKWSAYFHYSAVKLRTQHNHRHSIVTVMVWCLQQ